MFRSRASCRYVCQIVGVLDNLTELNAEQVIRIQRGDIVNKKTTGFLVALLAGAFILVGQQPAEASKGKHHKNWRGVYSNNYNYNYKRGKNHRKNWKKYNRHNNWNNGVGNNCWTYEQSGTGGTSFDNLCYDPGSGSATGAALPPSAPPRSCHSPPMPNVAARIEPPWSKAKIWAFL